MDVVIDSNRKSKLYALTEGANKPAGIPQQAQYVFYAMQKLGKLASPETIGEQALELGMKTKQPASRIVQYYIPTLNKFGIIQKQ